MSRSDEFDRALEALLEDRSPRNEAGRLDAEEQRMLRMAQLLRGSRGQETSPEFVRRLHDGLSHRPRKIRRRTAFLSGLGALAAGLAAGFGLDRAVTGPSSATTPTEPGPLVSARGAKWFRVAHVAELPPGAVRGFTAGAVQGFLINHGGEIRAVSRICTHMGCTLNFSTQEQALVCPCHGAEFDLRGRLRYGPGDKRYKQQIPPLPPLSVRVNDQSVEVWSV